MRPTLLFASRLMPPRIVGGAERLSQDVMDCLAGSYPIVDLTNRRGRAAQPAYLASLPLRLRAHARRQDGPVVAHGTDATLAGPLAMARLPSLMRVNGLDLLYPNPMYQAILARSLPKVDQVVAISRPTASLLAKAGVPDGKVTIITPSAEAPAGWRPVRQAGRILHVGRLVPRKGVVEFVEAVWPLVLRQVPEARLDIVGDGPERERLLAAIAQAPGRDRIVWHGQAPDSAVADLYRTADVFIMNNQPTGHDFEGFGIVAIEASVRGVPVVARRLDGVVDAVQEGVTGHLVPPGDDPAFAEAVAGILGGARLRDRAALLALAQERWGHDRVRREYEAVIDAMVQP